MLLFYLLYKTINKYHLSVWYDQNFFHFHNFLLVKINISKKVLNFIIHFFTLSRVFWRDFSRFYQEVAQPRFRVTCRGENYEFCVTRFKFLGLKKRPNVFQLLISPRGKSQCSRDGWNYLAAIIEKRNACRWNI